MKAISVIESLVLIRVVSIPELPGVFLGTKRKNKNKPGPGVCNYPLNLRAAFFN